MDLQSIFVKKLTPGIVLHNPTGSPFTIEGILSNRLIIRAGITEHSALPFEAFNEVNEYLSKMGWVTIGAVHGRPKPGTIDEIVQKHTQGMSAASYLISILVKIGMVELNPKRPARTRIIR